MIGWACAQRLAARGAVVLVVEPGPLPGAATPAAAGMLAAQAEAGAGVSDTVLALHVLARSRALAIVSELSETTGVDVGLSQTGILHLALAQSDADHLRDAVARQRRLGLRAEWLDAAAVRHGWPVAAPALGAAFLPEDAALDPRALVAGLRAASERAGVRVARERVVALEIRGGRVSGVRGADGRHRAGAVVIAAGAWSAVLDLLPRPLPVEPMRGQMLALPWPGGMAPAILYGAGGYVLSRREEALVGSTMESVGFEPTTTPEAEARLSAVAGTLAPTLARVPVVRSWAGLRPMTPDGLPIIGRSAELEGLWYATGHGRNGILLAALTGEIIADLMLTGRSAVDGTPFRPTRFGSDGQQP